MLLKFKAAEAKSFKPRPKGTEANAEAEAIILASRPVWSQDFNISGYCPLDSSEVRSEIENMIFSFQLISL